MIENMFRKIQINQQHEALKKKKKTIHSNFSAIRLPLNLRKDPNLLLKRGKIIETTIPRAQPFLQ